MQEKKNQAWIWVGLLVVVLIVIFAFAFRPGTPETPGIVPNQAPAGQTVAGFPQGLILAPNASIGSSYSLTYSTSTSQYTAQFNATSSVSAMFKSYESYLQANGWTLVTVNQTSPVVETIYATNASSGVTVFLTVSGKGSQVTVSYVTQ